MRSLGFMLLEQDRQRGASASASVSKSRGSVAKFRQVHPPATVTGVTDAAEPMGDPECKKPRWERARGAGPGPLSAPGRAARGRADHRARRDRTARARVPCGRLPGVSRLDRARDAFQRGAIERAGPRIHDPQAPRLPAIARPSWPAEAGRGTPVAGPAVTVAAWSGGDH